MATDSDSDSDICRRIRQTQIHQHIITTAQQANIIIRSDTGAHVSASASIPVLSTTLLTNRAFTKNVENTHISACVAVLRQRSVSTW